MILMDLRTHIRSYISGNIIHQVIYLYFIFLRLYLSRLLIVDIFKIKEKKGKTKNMKEKNEEAIDFEEYTDSQTYTTFYQMNLSRPLLKVILLSSN